MDPISFLLVPKEVHLGIGCKYLFIFVVERIQTSCYQSSCYRRYSFSCY